MKNNYNIKLILTSLGIVLLALLSYGFYSTSANNFDSYPYINCDSDSNIKTYTFDTNENGKITHWTAIIRNGKVDVLYKNDEKLSDSEAAKYKEIVLENTKKLDESLSSHNEFYFPDSCFYFNSEAFKKQMEELNKRMKNFKLDFHFDKKNYEKMMEQLHKNLEKLKDEKFFDNEKWKDIDHKLSEAFHDHDFDFHFNFDKLNMSLDKLNLKMDHLKEKMKNMKEFLKDVKSELIKDGYLDINDDKFDLDFTKDRIEVNGKRLPDSLLEKYKKIYKDHFGKEMDDRFRIIN
jgi:chaperonin cofactor prefoldin